MGIYISMVVLMIISLRFHFGKGLKEKGEKYISKTVADPGGDPDGTMGWT